MSHSKQYRSQKIWFWKKSQSRSQKIWSKKSIGISLEKTWSQKIVSKIFGLKKVLVSVSKIFGIKKSFCIGLEWNFWSRHSVLPSVIFCLQLYDLARVDFLLFLCHQDGNTSMDFKTKCSSGWTGLQHQPILAKGSSASAVPVNLIIKAL